jgi:hypothetical protein
MVVDEAGALATAQDLGLLTGASHPDEYGRANGIDHPQNAYLREDIASFVFAPRRGSGRACGL